MANYTKHRMTQLYEKYHEIEVTFNKKVVEYTRFIPGEITLKIGNERYSCILNSSSMVGAHIILKADKTLFEKINDNKGRVFLRFAFQRDKSAIPLSFFVESRVKSSNPLKGNSQNLFIIHIEYSKQPPDDFIEILGTLIDAGANNKHRQQNRITLNNEAMELLHLESGNGVLNINNQNIPCIIREISQSGCKIIAKITPEQCENQNGIFAFKFAGDTEYSGIPGKIVRTESIKDNQEFLVLGMEFVGDKVPALLVRYIDEYFSKT
ncbi:MAG: PilZ domain-containing protein [Spirochaetales bacterium]|nr:PilZ domain-containing protein [Spirochaetales bacterium]